jgi:uncharacterized membrane protein YbhN (UPF0104 family)
VPLPAAFASVFVNTVGAAIAELAIVLAVLPSARNTINLSLVPWQGMLAGALAVGTIVIVAGAVVWRVPRARDFVVRPARAALDNLQGVLHSPSKLTLIVGGQVLVQLMNVATLKAATRAFGASVPLTSLLLVNIASSTLSGLIPAPGGLGVAETTLAGALTATGVPAPTAISIALSYRLVTTWIPWVPGWLALRALQRHEDL